MTDLQAEVRITARVTEEMRRAVKRLVIDQGTSIEGLVNKLLVEELTRASTNGAANRE